MYRGGWEDGLGRFRAQELRDDGNTRGAGSKGYDLPRVQHRSTCPKMQGSFCPPWSALSTIIWSWCAHGASMVGPLLRRYGHYMDTPLTHHGACDPPCRHHVVATDMAHWTHHGGTAGVPSRHHSGVMKTSCCIGSTVGTPWRHYGASDPQGRHHGHHGASGPLWLRLGHAKDTSWPHHGASDPP